MSKRLPVVFRSLARLGSRPDDSAELSLQKTLLVFSSVMIATLAAVWGVVYWIGGEPLAGCIPLLYSGLSFTSLAYFSFTRRYRMFRSSQLLLTLLLPFFLMLALGGFRPSSAVILWSLTSPLGALVFADRNAAWRWLLGFLALLLAGAVLEPFIARVNHLPVWLVTIFFTINIGFTAVVIFVLLSYAVRQRDLTMGRLHEEEQKSNRLLLNILPEEIARELKQNERTIARQYEEASILFADIVDFTPLSARLDPTELVDLLNAVFSYMDTLADRFGLEKIKTIGDCYMVAAGIPQPQADHAIRLTDMALAIRKHFLEHSILGHRIAIRMGINSGPVVAGVIGRRKFAYDLWGDAVNTASRMESHGVPGEIRVTRSTWTLINDRFDCEDRGTIQVKGKGPLEVWAVLGRKSAAD